MIREGVKTWGRGKLTGKEGLLGGGPLTGWRKEIKGGKLCRLLSKILIMLLESFAQ